MTDLSTVKSREKLKPQREPYWQKLAQGQFLGYRPSTLGKGGSWTARARDSETKKQRYQVLGSFRSLPLNEHFSAASAAAREWFAHLNAGGSHELITVAEACRQYANENPDAEKRFTRYVYSDPIAKVQLQKLTDRQVRDWRKRLEELPALVSRSNKGEAVTRRRAPSTLNRDMVPFRAALNLALANGHALSARAWKRALEPVEAEGRRELYLDKDQRREYLSHFSADIKPFARALCLLPLRPGALAKVVTGDFDYRKRELVISRDKNGKARRIPLAHDAAEVLKEQARSKLPAAPLFSRADGKAWNKDSWKYPFKKAAEAAGFDGATAYTLRHSTITDLVQSGLPLLTIGQISGTSVKMIEKHYGHLQQEHAVKALASLAL